VTPKDSHLLRYFVSPSSFISANEDSGFGSILKPITLLICTQHCTFRLQHGATVAATCCISYSVLATSRRNGFSDDHAAYLSVYYTQS